MEKLQQAVLLNCHPFLDYRARYYSPELGRFISRDPIGYEDGMNLYAYVKNNPINWVDPQGTSVIIGGPNPALINVTRIECDGPELKACINQAIRDQARWDWRALPGIALCVYCAAVYSKSKTFGGYACDKCWEFVGEQAFEVATGMSQCLKQHCRTVVINCPVGGLL